MSTSKMPSSESHYKWLDRNLPAFFSELEVSPFNPPGGLISAHGDKFYSYRDIFEKAGMSFPEGVAIGLLSYIRPYASECRETEHGWVPVEKWIVDNKDRFLPILRRIAT